MLTLHKTRVTTEREQKTILKKVKTQLFCTTPSNIRLNEQIPQYILLHSFYVSSEAT